MKKIFLTKRFFITIGLIIVLFATSFLFQTLFIIAQFALVLLAIIAIVDGIILFSRRNIVEVERNVPAILSLGDPNEIKLTIQNNARFTNTIEIYDEFPYQLQIRDFSMKVVLNPLEKKELIYDINPKKRGAYQFGKINVFSQNKIGLLMRKDRLDKESEVKVYPSVIQMKKYELSSFKSLSLTNGVKKIRKIGHSYEYEQIRNYVIGDDPRSINWKAGSRVGNLMVNQYEDEKSQQVYCILDKSRSMRMPFNGLSLLDYAINSSLVISNVGLQKHDRVGLISFSDKIGSLITADSKRSQLSAIFKALYNEKEHRLEADYELLYSAVRNFIRVRSLLFLYTNFESLNALHRVLPLLRKLNKNHLLVVMFFENSEIASLAEQKPQNVNDIYLQTISRKMQSEKQLICQELRKYNIQTIMSKPEDLSINTINKYLELKAREMI